jgi:hypothetical protein
MLEFPSNPYDKTIWDPIDSNWAIEDPLHGPSAMHQLLRKPPMPLGNGIYLSPGLYYMEGTIYEDSNEHPVYRIGESYSTTDFFKQLKDLEEWTNYSRLGEDVLTALEAQRQKKRMHKLGYASCFKATDVCPGGEKLIDCPTGRQAYRAGKEYAEKYSEYLPKQGNSETTLASGAKKCTECSVSCEVAVIAENGEPKYTRVNFFEQDPDDEHIIKLNLEHVISQARKPKIGNKIRQATEDS